MGSGRKTKKKLMKVGVWSRRGMFKTAVMGRDVSQSSSSFKASLGGTCSRLQKAPGLVSCGKNNRRQQLLVCVSAAVEKTHTRLQRTKQTQRVAPILMFSNGGLYIISLILITWTTRCTSDTGYSGHMSVWNNVTISSPPTHWRIHVAAYLPLLWNEMLSSWRPLLVWVSPKGTGRCSTDKYFKGSIKVGVLDLKKAFDTVLKIYFTTSSLLVQLDKRD